MGRAVCGCDGCDGDSGSDSGGGGGECLGGGHMVRDNYCERVSSAAAYGVSHSGQYAVWIWSLGATVRLGLR